MGLTRLQASAVMNAPAAKVYEVLSDYQEGHPAILPRKYFIDLTVEEGGRGAGTVFLVKMKVMGKERTSRMTVTEPDPGRVLMEADAEAGVTTTFTVDPLEGETGSLVTISTEINSSGGIKGFLEGLFVPLVLRRIYEEELDLLAGYLIAGGGSRLVYLGLNKIRKAKQDGTAFSGNVRRNSP